MQVCVMVIVRLASLGGQDFNIAIFLDEVSMKKFQLCMTMQTLHEALHGGSTH